MKLLPIALVAAILCIALSAKAGDPSKIMVFGDQDHKTYLGCLSCSEYASDSIWNQYGDFGSRYATNSMWNIYGTYGSRYSSYSPCNEYASESPVIVDGAGRFYGYLSVSTFRSNGKAQQVATTICKEALK